MFCVWCCKVVLVKWIKLFFTVHKIRQMTGFAKSLTVFIRCHLKAFNSSCAKHFNTFPWSYQRNAKIYHSQEKDKSCWRFKSSKKLLNEIAFTFRAEVIKVPMHLSDYMHDILCKFTRTGKKNSCISWK
jgi:hypothetical protein